MQPSDPDDEVRDGARLTPVAAPRPLVIVVAEPNVFDALATDADIDLHPDRYDSYAAFLIAARDRKVPLDRTPVVVIVSDALPEEGEVSLTAFVSMMRDVAVVIAWAGSEHNGVVEIRGDVTRNTLRRAIATRTGLHLSSLVDGDELVPTPLPPTPFEVASPIDVVEDPIAATSWVWTEPATANGEPRGSNPAPSDVALNDEPSGEPGPDAISMGSAAMPDEASRIAARITAPHPPRRRASVKLVGRAPTSPSAPPPPNALATPPGPAGPAGPPSSPDLGEREPQGFWNRWVPAADGSSVDHAEDFSDLAAALAEPDQDEIANWKPRSFTDVTFDEVTGQHDVVGAEARPFDLAPTEAELAGELFAPATERDHLPVSQAQILAVYSPKGGVGKTSIAVNLASRLALKTNLQVCVVDLDLGFGNVGTRLGLFMPTVREILAEGTIDNESVSRNLAYDPRTGLHALLAPLRPEVRADKKIMRLDAFDRILHVLAERFDVIILDCPVEITDPIVAEVACKRAHRVVMVLNNEQATLTDGRRAIETMCRPRTGTRTPGIGVHPHQIGIIVNQKVDGVGRNDVGVEQLLAGADEDHPAHSVPVLTSIPDDRVTWVRNANLGRPVATNGDTAIDRALDTALGALIPGAAALLGVQPTVIVPGVEDVWVDAPAPKAAKRLRRGRRG